MALGGGAEEEGGDQPNLQDGVLVGGDMGKFVGGSITVEVAGGGVAMGAEEEEGVGVQLGVEVGEGTEGEGADDFYKRGV